MRARLKQYLPCVSCGSTASKYLRKGLCGRCSQREYAKVNIEEKLIKLRAYRRANRASYRENEKRASEKRRAGGYWQALAKFRKTDPSAHLKLSARIRFKNAQGNGWINPPRGIEFHHPDYQRPYFGSWVTPSQHRLIHTGEALLPECVDYAEYFKVRAEYGRALTYLKESRILATCERWLNEVTNLGRSANSIGASLPYTVEVDAWKSVAVDQLTSKNSQTQRETGTAAETATTASA